MSVKLNPKANTWKKVPREQFVNHPDFQKMFDDAREGVFYPIKETPGNFHVWLSAGLANLSFGALKIPVETYENLIGLAVNAMPLAILKIAINTIIFSTPDNHKCDTEEYAFIIKQALTMKKRVFEIESPIRESVIDQLILKEAPSIIQ